MSIGPVRLLPEIYNISDFVQRDHPNYHPDTLKYVQYWEAQEKLCIEGKWGHDYDESRKLGGYRYMPGFLYFYINMWTILHTVRKQRRRFPPNLRDVEWILSYAWLSARGFSGFELDDEYTCNEAVLLEIDDETLLREHIPTESGEYKDLYTNNLFHNGKRKKYKPAFEYLKQTFDKPLGRPIYGNPAKNLMVLGSRNFGKSFFTSGAIIGHEWIFDGHKYYDYDYLNKPNEISLFVGSSSSDKSSELLNFFKNGFSNLPGSYGANDDFIPSPFFKNVTGNLNPNNKQSAFRHSYKVQEGGIWRDKGSKSTIYHGVYTVDNYTVAVGGRYGVIVLEEIGLMKNLLSVLGANNLCQTDGIERFGSTIAIGTGGNMETVQEAKMVFYDPDSYDFLGFDNIFETGGKKIGLFIPAYLAFNQYKDDKGNTNIQGAWDHIEKVREKARKASTNTVLNDEMMSRPVIPTEMFLSNNFSIFPVADLQQRLAELETTNEWSEVADIGMLEFLDKERKSVKWFRDIQKMAEPITTVNLDKYRGNLSGAMIIYEHPIKALPEPTFYRPLYKIAYDPVKDDKWGPSLGSILVYKGYEKGSMEGKYQDDIVAECLMRTDSTEDIHEAAIKLALYYNAKVMPETDIPDFIRYCKKLGIYHILQPSPHEAVSRVIKAPTKKYDVGQNMAPGLGIHCEQLINNWLCLPYRERDGRLFNNCYKLKSKRLIEELINYKREGNFDHISTLKLIMLWNSQEIDVSPEYEQERKDVFLDLKKKLKEARRSERINPLKQLYYTY